MCPLNSNPLDQPFSHFLSIWYIIDVNYNIKTWCSEPVSWTSYFYLYFCGLVFSFVHRKGKALQCLQFMKTTADIFRVYIRRKITKIFERNNLSAFSQKMKMDLLGSTCSKTGLLFKQCHLMKAMIKKKQWKSSNMTCEGRSAAITYISHETPKLFLFIWCSLHTVLCRAHELENRRRVLGFYLKQNTLAYEYFS